MTPAMIGSGLLVLAGVLAILGGSAIGFRAWRQAEHDAQADQAIATMTNTENVTMKIRVREMERLLTASREFLEKLRAERELSHGQH
jgi:hypothetical protein